MADFTRIYHRKPYAAIDPTQAHLSQAGRTVLVTGASGGVGKSIAKAFAQASADRVIIAARRIPAMNEVKAEIEALGGPTVVQVERCDISDNEEVTKLFKTLAEKKIDVDVLVLNAVSLSMLPSLLSEDANEKLTDIYKVNVLGQQLFTQKFLAQGKETGKVLLNVSSAAAHCNPVIANQHAYSTSKAAFSHMFQTLAHAVPIEKCQMIQFHPGTLYSPGAQAVGFPADAFPWDHMDLPAHFAVWAASKEATFLHGRFAWAGWGVDELKAMKSKIENDLGMLRFGLLGTNNVDPAKLLTEQALKDDATNYALV